MTGWGCKVNFIEQLTAAVLLVDFFLGVACGVVGSAVHGSKREDRESSLLRGAPGPLSAGARVIFGKYSSSDEYMRSLLRRGREATAEERGGDHTGAEGQEAEQ